MKCKDAAQIITESQHHSLSWRQRVGLRFHLLMCDACRNFASQMALLTKATKLWPIKAKAENVLSEEARERIANRLTDERKQKPDK